MSNIQDSGLALMLLIFGTPCVILMDFMFWQFAKEINKSIFTVCMSILSVLIPLVFYINITNLILGCDTVFENPIDLLVFSKPAMVIIAVSVSLVTYKYSKSIKLKDDKNNKFKGVI